MAEIVNLASFDINSEKAKKELDALTLQLHELGIEQKQVSKESNDLQKQITELEKAEKSATGITKEQTAELLKLKTQQEVIVRQKRDLSNQTKVVSAEYNVLNNALKTRITTEGEALRISEAVNNALAREVTTIDAARKSTSEIIKLRNQLNPAIAEENELLKQLNIQVDSNTSFIKQNSSAMEQQKLNIGNYKADIEAALGSVKGLTNGFGGFTDSIQKMSVLGDGATKALKSITSSVYGLTKAVIGFILTPFGAVITAIVIAFTLVKNAMNQSTEAMAKVNRLVAALSSVFTGLLKVLEPLGTYLIDGLVEYFEALGAAAEKASKVVSGALRLFGLKDYADAVDGFVESTKASIEAAYELAKAEALLEAQQSKATKSITALQRESDKLKQIRDDETKSLSERLAASDAIAKNTEKQIAIEKALALQAVATAQLRIKANGETKESSEELYKAQQTLLDLEDRTAAQLSEQNKFRANLQKEAAEKAKAQREKNFSDAIKRMSEELDLFIANEGVKAKTLQENLEFNRNISEKNKKILQTELAAGLISRTKYNTELKKLANQEAQELINITVDNAKRELDEYIKLNNDKHLLNQRLNDENYTLETERLRNIFDQEQAFNQLSFEQGLINKQEYNDALTKLDEDYLVKQKTLTDNFEAVKKEDKKISDQLDREAAILKLQEDLVSDYEIEKIIQEGIYIDKQATLEEQLQKGLITEANYNKAIENLDREHSAIIREIDSIQLNEKLNAYADTFGSIGKLVGDQTKAGKAAGIATATINTYQGVSEVFKSPSVLPEPASTILKLVQAGVTTASGLKAVSDIAKVKVPAAAPIQGFATGGIVSRNSGLPISRSNGDNVLATLRTDEAVLNESQRSFIGDDILALSGMPLDGAAGSTVGQGSQMMVELAEAVRQGAASGTEVGSSKGSAKGITGLSDNRNLQLSATF